MTDYRRSEATLGNERAPNYYCARYTTNGHDITQRCNPTPGANSGVTRAMFTEMVDYLKKGHWIDRQTRMVLITMQLRSNNFGLRFLSRFMFEITNMGAVLPSFDMEAMLDDEGLEEEQNTWMFVALLLVAWFIMLEAIEIWGSGPAEYFCNLWNVMDWANFLLFFMVYSLLSSQSELNARDNLRLDSDATSGAHDCGSVICNQFGFMDTWEVMNTARDAKFYMSMCVCLQLLKIIKFTNVIVPKMSLMTRVLGKGATDLAFFGIIFGISVFAFTMLLFIQLGTFMDDFTSQEIALLGLVRALFGDFSFEEIMDNSRGYTNAIFFLVYLFVSVFILLSMFLAILGESQAAAREEEAEEKRKGELTDYGTVGEVLFWAKVKAKKFVLKLLKKGGDEDDEGGEGGEGDEDEDEDEDVATMKAAILMMQAKLEDKIKARVSTLESTLLKRIASLETTALARRKLRQQAQARSASSSPGLARRNSCSSRTASQAGSGGGICGCSTDSPRRRGPSPADGKAAGGSRPNMSASRRAKSPDTCGTCSGRVGKDGAAAEKMGNFPSCSSRNKEKANLQKSHPGRSYEREWSKMRSAARVVQATDGIAKKKNKTGKEYVVDDDFEA